jgi:hypothetical protein
MIKKLLAAVIGIMILCTPVNAWWRLPTEQETRYVQSKVKAGSGTFYLSVWQDARYKLIFMGDKPNICYVVFIYEFCGEHKRFEYVGMDIASTLMAYVNHITNRNNGI